MKRFPKMDKSIHWPANEIRWWDIDDLQPYDKNSRTHTEAQIDQLCTSMGEWGWTVPILVDEHGGIIAGHGRYEAAKRLGYSKAPCTTAVGWTETQKRAYVIADNKLTENSTWDLERLGIELSEIRAEGFEISLTGFDDHKFAEILEDTDFSAVGSIDENRLSDQQTECTCPKCGHKFDPFE